MKVQTSVARTKRRRGKGTGRVRLSTGAVQKREDVTIKSDCCPLSGHKYCAAYITTSTLGQLDSVLYLPALYRCQHANNKKVPACIVGESVRLNTNISSPHEPTNHRSTSAGCDQ